MQYILFFVLIILFPLCGIQALQEGEIGMAIFFFSPVMSLIFFLVIKYCIVVPRQKRQEAAHKMYKLPARIDNDYGEIWGKEFQEVLKNAIETTTDSAKLTDLQNCQRVANQMKGNSSPYRLDRPFYKINNAFRLTGCHFIITDSEGKTITQIV
jgi:hypothetical protein